MLQPVLLFLFAGVVLAADLPAFTAPEDPGSTAPPEFTEPVGELSLADAAALSLLHNPDLAVVAWEIRAREAETLQAGLRPNPELGLEVENFGGSGGASGFDGAETTLSLSQLLERGGKRKHGREAARLDRELAEWDYEALRHRLYAEVTAAFVDLLAAQEQERIAGELVAVAEQSLATMTRRVEAGAVSPVEETRARVALARSRLDRRAAQQRLDAARVELASLWGSVAPRFDRAVGDLEPVSAPPPLEDLRARAADNPDLARWDTELARRRADIALERALGATDLAVEAGVRHLGETDDVAFTVGVAVPLPISDRNQGGRRAAEFRLSRTEDDARAARVAVERAVTVAHQTLVAEYEEVLALDEEILPQAETAFETALDAHRKGLFRFTDVLDTRRTLFELRARRVEILRDYHRTRAELERLTGGPLSGERR